MNHTPPNPFAEMLQLQQKFWESGFGYLQQLLRGQSDFIHSLKFSLPGLDNDAHAATLQRIKQQTDLFSRWGDSLLEWLEGHDQAAEKDLLAEIEAAIVRLSGDQSVAPDWGLGFWRQQQELLMQVAPAPLFAHWPLPQSATDQSGDDYVSLVRRWIEQVTRIQLDALKGFQQRWQAREHAGEVGLDQLYDLWIESCEAAYQERAKSDEFAHLYGELVNSLNRMVAGLKPMINEWLAMVGLPTPQEYDELAERYQQLRRECWDLQEQLNRQREDAGQA